MFTVSDFQSKHDIRTIRQDEPNFMLSDGLILYPRAMIHILPECPGYLRDAVNTAVASGYVKCVAHVQGKELTWESLTK